MKDMISYCGIDCSACPTYRATQADDDAKRAKVADFWSKMFKTRSQRCGHQLRRVQAERREALRPLPKLRCPPVLKGKRSGFLRPLQRLFLRETQRPSLDPPQGRAQKKPGGHQGRPVAVSNNENKVTDLLSDRSVPFSYLGHQIIVKKGKSLISLSLLF